MSEVQACAAAYLHYVANIIAHVAVLEGAYSF